MKTPMLGLRTAVYLVNDISVAKKWYNEAFGVDPYFDEPFYVGFSIQGFELGLLPSEIKPGDKAKSVYVYWGVENIHEEFKRLLKLGATEDEAPNNVGGDLMVASVKDPWGNLLGIIYNPYFTLDEKK